MIVMAFVVPSLRLWPMSTVWISFILRLLLRMRHAWLVQRRVGRASRHGLAASIGAMLLVLGVFGVFAALSWYLVPSVEASLLYRFVLALDHPEFGPALTAVAVALLVLMFAVYVARSLARRRPRG